MDSVARSIQKALPKLEQRIIDTDMLLEEFHLPESKKGAALRELSRLEESNQLTRLTKGIYIKNELSRITKKNKPVSERDIINYYTRENSGLTVGYDLYNRKNISTQVSKKRTVLSSMVKRREKTVKTIKIKRVDAEINLRTKKFFEALEVVENADKIQDFNESGFKTYMQEFSKEYEKNIMIEILKKSNYKKQTIYNLHKIIEMLGKDSGLEVFLNSTSSYKVNKAYETMASRG